MMLTAEQNSSGETVQSAGSPLFLSARYVETGPEGKRQKACRTGKTAGKSGKQLDTGQIMDIIQQGVTDMSSQNSCSGRGPLPVSTGPESFPVLASGCCYVDKTMMIRDLLDRPSLVCLITRPRGFGKTVNMGMLQSFFEPSGEDMSVLFRDRQIWSCGEKYTSHQGKHPVIFLSLKDTAAGTWEEFLEKMRRAAGSEAARHGELLTSSRCTGLDRQYLERLTGDPRNISQMELEIFLLMLSRALTAHYRSQTVILIDEYDTPVLGSPPGRCRDEVIKFLRNLFSMGLQGNSSLMYGVLTGVMPLLREGIFDGVTGLWAFGVLDEPFSEYFGFTGSEVQTVLDTCGCSERYSEISSWFGGYQFGNRTLCCPWSLNRCLLTGGRPGLYWSDISGNSPVRDLLRSADPETLSRLETLLEGGSVPAVFGTAGAPIPEPGADADAVLRFLLQTGYLTGTVSEMYPEGFCLCSVRIPNREMLFLYRRELASCLLGAGGTAADMLQTVLQKGDVPALQEQLCSILSGLGCILDPWDERSAPGICTGLNALLRPYYRRVREEPGGEDLRVRLEPVQGTGLPGICIEFRRAGRAGERRLERLAAKALSAAGSGGDLCFGAAISGKRVKVRTGLRMPPVREEG